MACVRLSFFARVEQEMIFCGQFGLPAGLDHDGLMRLDDDGGTFDAHPASADRAYRRSPCASVGGKELRPQRRLGQAARERFTAFSLNLGRRRPPRPTRLRPPSAWSRSMNPNRALCAFSNARFMAAAAAGGHDQRRVGAGVANMRADEDLILAAGTPWPATSALVVLAERCAAFLQSPLMPWRRTAARSPARAWRGYRQAPCRRRTEAKRTDA